MALVPVLALAGCGRDDDSFVILAASSLTDTGAQLADAFAQDEADDEATLDFAGSNVLVTQVVEGRRADVLLTADAASMQRAVDADAVVGQPVVFARNRLTIVVPTGNPAGIVGLDDLSDSDHVVAICGPDVPCGRLTTDLLDTTGVEITAATLDPSVRSVLTRVQAGSVDAGIVYVTDARAAGSSVDTIELPVGTSGTTPYLAAAVAPSTQAMEFVTFLLSDRAQQILAGAGFEQP
ncbi:MAG: molybdate ABC transporter substrate-binding protein [Acidimicrobiales bacterium]